VVELSFHRPLEAVEAAQEIAIESLCRVREAKAESNRGHGAMADRGWEVGHTSGFHPNRRHFSKEI